MRIGTEREGVSFKLEIASSAAMMGRKLGAKLNARERVWRMSWEGRGEGGERRRGVKQPPTAETTKSNNILIFVRSREVEDCCEGGREDVFFHVISSAQLSCNFIIYIYIVRYYVSFQI